VVHVTRGTGVISGVRVTHDLAGVDELAAAGVGDEDDAVTALLDQPGVEEAFALETCNRVEYYVVTPAPDAGQAALASAGATHPDGVGMGHEESLRHLLRVAAGLESMVLGEDQILGQLRDAFETAREAGGVGPVLEEALTKAIHVGERARTETAINKGATSLGTAAARLLDAEYGLDDATALVAGAGEMGSLAARALADADLDRVVVANRTPGHARDLAADLPVDAAGVGLDALPDRAAAADVVVSATGSDDLVLDADALADAGETAVVDLGQPRDVTRAAADLPGVTVYDLDDLEAVTAGTTERRQEAAAEVAAMVDREFDRLLDQYKRKRADEVVAAMYESADRLKHREVATALSRLEAEGDLSDGQREIVESLADALVSQLLAAPTKSLRDAAAEDDWTTINTALQLFDPEFEDRGPPAFVDADAGAAAEDAGETGRPPVSEGDD
jgi:glutamyl-tRNA reductase